VDKGKVTFTDNGYCRVDSRRRQRRLRRRRPGPADDHVGTGGLLTQTTLSLFTTGGTYGKNLVLLSSGGSGTGAVSFVVTTIGTAGCPSPVPP